MPCGPVGVPLSPSCDLLLPGPVFLLVFFPFTFSASSSFSSPVTVSFFFVIFLSCLLFLSLVLLASSVSPVVKENVVFSIHSIYLCSLKWTPIFEDKIIP